MYMRCDNTTPFNDGFLHIPGKASSVFDRLGADSPGPKAGGDAGAKVTVTGLGQIVVRSGNSQTPGSVSSSRIHVARIIPWKIFRK